MAKRARLEQPAAVGETVTLSPAESHHLVVVRRAQAGETVVLLDGQGGVGKGALTNAHKARAAVEVTGWEEHAPVAPAVTLAVAIPKNKTMDVVVHQATELGVRRIVPLLTAHGEVWPKGLRAAEKRAKWQQIVREAQKQCGNPWTPEVEAPMPLLDYRATQKEGTEGPDASVRLVAALHPAAQPPSAVLAMGNPPKRVVIAVGPEGDFSPAEYEALFAAAYQPVTLGPLVLKVDTACVALVSQVLATGWSPAPDQRPAPGTPA